MEMSIMLTPSQSLSPAYRYVWCLHGQDVA
jgi:hypothetical protein